MPRIQRLYVETTSACNLRCIHCAINTPGYTFETMDLKTFGLLTPALKRYRPIVHLSGHGETLLHKDFVRMLEASVGAGCRVVFQTNATLLTPERSAQLLKYAGRRGLFHITVSMDAAEKALFEKIRRRSDFDAVVGNLKALDAMKKAGGLRYPTVGYEFVAMLMSVHQLPDSVRLAHSLGAKLLTVADLTEYSGMEGQRVASDPGYALPFLKEAAALARTFGLRFDLFPYLRHLLYGGVASEAPARGSGGHEKRRLKACYDPWSLAYVRPNGDVIPCCWIWEPMGNVNRDPLIEIWDGPAYTGLRKAVGGLKPPRQCTACQVKGWTEVRHSAFLTSALLRLRLRARTLCGDFKD